MKKLFTSSLICFTLILGNFSLYGQYMTSVVNSAADDEFAHPWDDPDTPDNDESVDGVCEDEQHRCTFRAALEEAYNVGKPALVTFEGNTVIVISEDNGPFDIPEGSRILGADQNISILGQGESTFLLVGVNNNTVIQGMILGNAVIGMTLGDNNFIGSSSADLRNYFGNMVNEGILIAGNGNHVTGNVIGLDDMDVPSMNLFGIRVYGNDNVIEGNVISGNGIGLSGYRVDSLGGNNYIIGNKVGTNIAGTEGRGNQVGLEIIGSGFVIGGAGPDSGNVISGNFEEGILVGVQSVNVTIENNHIGVDKTGSIPIPNRDGITLGPGSSFVDVAHNLISKNVNTGILISGITGIESHDHLITGNEISFNGNAGIQVSGQSLNNIIGSSLVSDYETNHIKFNGIVGVGFISGIVGAPAFNTIRKNYFENNTIDGIGIFDSQEDILSPDDLDYSDQVVSGTYPVPGAVIDIYEAIRNSSGNYEGNEWLGSGIVNANGDVMINVSLCTCDTLVATATSPAGSTSEFSDGIPTMITATDEIKTINTISLYPNPFQQAITISFNLYTPQHISLKIFDASGREIESIANQKLPAGEHHFNWKANGRSDGVYYYRMVGADLSVEQGKMVLIN